MSHKHHSSLPESHDAADAWHQHSDSEHPQQPHGESVAVPQVLLYGAACFVIVVVCVVATMVYFYAYVSQAVEARVEHYDVDARPIAEQNQDPKGGHKDIKIQSEYLALKQKAEDETLKGLKTEGGPFDKVIAQYGKKRGN